MPCKKESGRAQNKVSDEKKNQDSLKTEESEVQELHQEKGILDTVRHTSSYMHASKQWEENAMLYVTAVEMH